MKNKLPFVLLICLMCALLESCFLNLCASQRHSNLNYTPPDSLIQELIVQVADSNLTASIQRLQDFWTRDVYSDSIAPSSYWISDKLHEFGYTDVELDSFEAVLDSVITLWNVVATKEGYGDSARVLIVGGHYDSVGEGGAAPGADDNASGVAATLEIARLLYDVPLYDTVKFIFFSCEEYYQYGSDHYSKRALNEGLDLELMLNLDMIANQDSTNFIKVCVDSTWKSTEEDVLYAALIADLTLEYTTIEPREIHRYPGNDTRSFMLDGFNAIWLWEYDYNLNSHGPDDLLEHLEIPFLREVTKIALATVVTVAEHNSEPSGIQDNNPVDVGLPRAFALNQNYPNPFNPTTTITFDVPGTAGAVQQVQLTIYNIRGKQVIRLVDSEYEPGSHKVVWNGKDEQGQQVSSGIYLYTLRSADNVYTRKMVLLK